MSRISELEVFVTVVDEKSFSAAADSLEVSKSHVSKSISGLEDRLGARLINRTTRSLSLTDVGQAFYDRCARILADVEEAELGVSNMQDTPHGVLRISVPQYLGDIYLAGVINAFLLEQPGVEVDVDYSERRVDVVEEGFDLVVRVGDLPDSSLIARKLCPVRRFVVGSPDYFERKGRPQTLDDLRNHDCLIYSLQGNTWTFRGPGGEDYSVRVQGRLRSNAGHALADAARRGLGLALLPDFLCAETFSRGELEVALADYSDWGACYAVYPHGRHLSAKVRAFVDHLVQHFESPPWADARLG